MSDRIEYLKSIYNIDKEIIENLHVIFKSIENRKDLEIHYYEDKCIPYIDRIDDMIHGNPLSYIDFAPWFIMIDTPEDSMYSNLFMEYFKLIIYEKIETCIWITGCMFDSLEYIFIQIFLYHWKDIEIEKLFGDKDVVDTFIGAYLFRRYNLKDEFPNKLIFKNNIDVFILFLNDNKKISSCLYNDVQIEKTPTSILHHLCKISFYNF